MMLLPNCFVIPEQLHTIFNSDRDVTDKQGVCKSKNKLQFFIIFLNVSQDEINSQQRSKLKQNKKEFKQFIKEIM